MNKDNIKKLIKTFLAVDIFILFMISSSLAAERKPLKTQTLIKTIEGEVVLIDKKTISIVYSRDLEKGVEYEMLLPYDKKELQLQHVKNLNEIKRGDIVSIEYEEIIEEYGAEDKKEDRKAKLISFIKPAVKELTTSDTEDTLPLKPLKGGG
jgi:uncharacterized membrane protein